jgi:hypothetical protein
VARSGQSKPQAPSARVVVAVVLALAVAGAGVWALFGGH